MKKLFLTFTATTLSLTSFTASSTPVSIGLGAGFTDPSYKGYSANYYPIPYIDFDNGIFFIDGLSAGAYLYNDESQSLSLGINYLPIEFKSRKTDNEQLKKLADRKSTILATIAYDHDFTWGTLAGSAGFDILDESNTILLNANYSFTNLFWDKIALTPSIGVNWLNKKHNNYYYGITESEFRQSGLPVFNAKSAFQPYLGLTATFLISKEWNAFIGARVDKLTGDMKDSPMTSHSTITSAYTGVVYIF